MTDAPEDVTSLNESWNKFLGGLKLKDLYVAALNGVRSDVLNGAGSGNDEEVSAALDVNGSQIQVSCWLSGEQDGGSFFAAVEAQFIHPDDFEDNEEFRQLFLDRVGMVVTYPLLRSTVVDLTARLGLSVPPLPLYLSGSARRSDPAAENLQADR